MIQQMVLKMALSKLHSMDDDQRFAVLNLAHTMTGALLNGDEPTVITILDQMGVSDDVRDFLINELMFEAVNETQD